MPRVNVQDRDIKMFLMVLLNREISVTELYEACGLTKHVYYGTPSGTGRGFADDFPDAEELRRIAKFYDLDFFNLCVEFQLWPAREGIRGYTDPGRWSIQPGAKPL